MAYVVNLLDGSQLATADGVTDQDVGREVTAGVRALHSCVMLPGELNQGAPFRFAVARREFDERGNAVLQASASLLDVQSRRGGDNRRVRPLDCVRQAGGDMRGAES